MNNSISTKGKAKEIDLKELYLVIKRRLWVIAALTILAGAVGIYQVMKPVQPLYQTSSRVIIGADEKSIATLLVIVKDYTVLDQVVQQLGLKESSDALAGQITVSSINGSQVVSISVQDTDPVRAAKIADTTAEVFKDEVPKIVGQDYVRLLSNAKVNQVPINPQSHKKALYYVIFGLVVGIVAAFFIESLDGTVRSEQDIDTILGAPILGKVSKMKSKNLKKQNSKRPTLEHRGESISYE